MSFHEQSFAARFGTMGDTAEGVFDLVHPKSHNLGLNRPPFTMSRMTPAMRYTPDRMTADAIYEVMGIGRDHTLKVKHEKFEALNAWDHIGPVRLFVYDQDANNYYDAPIEDWIDVADKYGVIGEFHEGKSYYGIHRRDFPCDPTEVPDAT